MDKITIKCLDQHIRYEILKKMSTVSLCRMRQTRSSLDIFVGGNRKRLSLHTKHGVNIYITKREDTAYVEICHENGKTRVEMDLFDFDRQLSGIPIKHFYIEVYERKDYTTSWKIFQIVKQIQPICETIAIRHFKNNLTRKMLEFFTIRDTAVIVPQDHRSDNQLFDECIVELNKMPINQQIKIEDTIISDVYVKGLFAKVKNFCQFGFIVSNADVFKTFLYEMYQARHSGNLKRVSCDITDYVGNIENTINFNNILNFTVLWSSESLPEKERSDLMFRFGLPICVRKFELANKFALVIENTYPLFSYEVLVVLVDKSPKKVAIALMDALRLSKVDEEFLEQYTNLDNDGQRRLLTSTILKKS